MKLFQITHFPRLVILFLLSSGLGLTASARTAAFQVVNDWGSGFSGSITVTNDGAQSIEDWELSFDFAGNIESIWNAEIISDSNGRYTVGNAPWNGNLSPGESVSFGFVGNPGNVAATSVTNFSFAGEVDDPGPVDPQPPADPDPQPEPDPDPGTDPVPDSGGDSPAPSTGSIDVAFDVSSIWSNGYTAYLRLTNTGDIAVDGWTLSFDLSDTISNFWSATDGSRNGDTYTFSNESWNGVILPGQTVSFGVQTSSADSQAIYNVSLNGSSSSPETPDNGSGEVPDDPTNDDGTGGTPPGDSGDGTPPNGGDPAPSSGEKRVVVYFPSWGIYQKDYQVEDLPAESLTHIIHAFATISDTGEIAMIDPWADIEIPLGPDTWDTPVRGNFGAYARLKQNNPHLRVLIAVGGWFDSDGFSDVAYTAAARQKFATSVRQFCVQYGFDGVDLDWEYPVVATGVNGNVRPEDSTNYAKLAAAIRAEFDAQGDIDGKYYEISAATPAGYDKFEKIDLEALAGSLDFINLMTYDLHGRWITNQTGHNAPLFASPGIPNQRYTADEAVSGYIAAGVPPEKLVLGIPAYGYGWSGVQNVNPYNWAADIGPGTLSVEPGFYDYRTVAALLKQYPSYAYWDEEAQASIYYDGNVWISFDGPRSLNRKLEYIEEKGLGGAMFWEASTDIRDNQDEDQLMKIAGDALRVE